MTSLTPLVVPDSLAGIVRERRRHVYSIPEVLAGAPDTQETRRNAVYVVSHHGQIVSIGHCGHSGALNLIRGSAQVGRGGLGKYLRSEESEQGIVEIISLNRNHREIARAMEDHYLPSRPDFRDDF